MITEYGMSDELGPYFWQKARAGLLGRDIARDRNYSEAVAYSIDKEARRIIEECYSEAEKLLKENISVLHRIAQTLIEKETIDAQEFADILREVGLGEYIDEKMGKKETKEKEQKEENVSAENQMRLKMKKHKMKRTIK